MILWVWEFGWDSHPWETSFSGKFSAIFRERNLGRERMAFSLFSLSLPHSVLSLSLPHSVLSLSLSLSLCDHITHSGLLGAM